MKKAPPALPGSPDTNPLTWFLTCSAHLSRASGDPVQVDVLASMRTSSSQPQCVCALRPPSHVAQPIANVGTAATRLRTNRVAKSALALRGIRRRLHRRAGERERAGARLALALRGLLGSRWLGSHDLFREDRALVLACEEPLELILVDRLALDEDRRDLVQLVHVLTEHGERELVRLLDDAADLVVDLARDLLGVVGLSAVVAAEERLILAMPEHARAELLAHAEAHDHLLRRRGHALEVVRSAGRHLVEDDLLRGATAERHRHLVHERGARRQVAILGRQRDRQAERLTARHD